MVRPFIDQNQRVKSNLNSMRESTKLSDKTKKEIDAMATKLSSEGLTSASIAKFVTTFHNGLARCAPKNFDLTTATEEDLRKLIVKIQESDYSIKTQAEIKKALKKYYKSNGKEKLVSFFKTHVAKNLLSIPSESDMITDTEVQSIIKACKNNRDKAIIALLAESGMRIGELGGLQIKHVTFDNNGAIITIPSGKTGARRIRCVQSERHLRQWLMDHPEASNPDAWLWINLNASKKSELHERMNYSAVRTVIMKKALDAGVKTYEVRKGVVRTRVHPHLFRHTTATKLAKHLTEQEMKKYLGWTAGSEMASVYVHLSGKDVDGAILKMNGVKSEEQQVESVRCQACGRANAVGSQVCNTCFRPLSVKSALVNEQREKKASELLNAILSGDITPEELKAFAKSRQK